MLTSLFAGVCMLAGCIPGVIRLILNKDGLTLFHLWTVKRLRWKAVTSIEESREYVGRSTLRGIRLSIHNGLPAEIFIQDLYPIRRKKLLLMMRELQARVSATS